MRNINKRGFWTLEETGKIVLGIVAVIVLLLLLSKLIGLIRHNSKVEQAKEMVEIIVDKINSMENGEGNVLIDRPRDFFIVLFMEGNPKSPPACAKKTCLCICSKRDKCASESGCGTLDVRILSTNEGKDYLKIKDIPSVLEINKEPNRVTLFLQSWSIQKETNRKILEETLDHKIGTNDQDIRELIINYTSKKQTATKSNLDKSLKELFKEEKMNIMLEVYEENEKGILKNDYSYRFKTEFWKWSPYENQISEEIELSSEDGSRGKIIIKFSSEKKK